MIRNNAYTDLCILESIHIAGNIVAILTGIGKLPVRSRVQVKIGTQPLTAVREKSAGICCRNHPDSFPKIRYVTMESPHDEEPCC